MARAQRQAAELRRQLKATEKRIASLRLAKKQKAKQAFGTIERIRQTPFSLPKRGATKKQKRAWASGVLQSAKRLGLTKSKRDPRKIAPDDPLIKKLWSDFQGVFKGKEIPVTVTPKTKRMMKKAGARIEGDKAFLKTKTKPIKIGAVRRVKIPIPYRDMPQYLNDLRTRKELELLKPPNAAWAFKVFGHDSYNTYASLDRMAVDFLQRYHAVQQGGNKGAEWVSHLAYLQVTPREWLTKPRARNKRYGGKRVR